MRSVSAVHCSTLFLVFQAVLRKPLEALWFIAGFSASSVAVQCLMYPTSSAAVLRMHMSICAKASLIMSGLAPVALYIRCLWVDVWCLNLLSCSTCVGSSFEYAV